MGSLRRVHSRPARAGLRLVAIVASISLSACTVSNVVVGTSETEVQKAVKAADVDRVRTLLAAGAELGHTLDEPDNAWTLALYRLNPSDARTVEILRLVLPRFAESQGKAPAALVNESIRRARAGQSSNWVYPAWIAAHSWSAEGLRVLIDNGLDPASPGAADALTTAASNGCEPCLLALLDAGTSPNATDTSNDTPLAMARRVRNARGVALLVSRGAQVPPAESSGSFAGTVARTLHAWLGPLVDGAPAPGETWIEGGAIATHPVGLAIVELAARAKADGDADAPVSDPDAVRRGFDAGSVLVVKGTTADLHLVRFGAPGNDSRATGATTTTTLTFEQAGNVWRLAASPQHGS